MKLAQRTDLASRSRPRPLSCKTPFDNRFLLTRRSQHEHDLQRHRVRREDGVHPTHGLCELRVRESGVCHSRLTSEDYLGLTVTAAQKSLKWV
jgi:hypothetical protein